MAIITPDNPAFGAAARDLGTPAYDPKKHDPFFDGLSDQLADKGFMLWFVGATVLFLSMYMSRDVPRQPKLWFMVFCNCKRKSAAKGILSANRLL